MKAIYRIIIAIFAAAAFAVSCSKDAVPGGGAQAVDGAPRVITLSYGGSTKAALSDFTPTFRDGDRVMLSNGTRTEECTVNVAGGKATVTTTLTGVLKAVTPASAAVTAGGDITYKIPVTQSGRFSDAAIATAHNIISSAELEIQVSLLKFYVDQSIKVKSITVESTQNIATAGTNLKQITVGTGTDFLHEIAEDSQQRLCYAAVLPGVPASSLKFTSDTDTQGTVIRQSPASTVTLAKNTLYKAFIPYYIKIGTQRWAYCNIGAFLPEEAGKYFAWGDVEGQTWDGSAWSDEGFSWAKAPFNNGSSAYNETYFNSHKSTFCPGDVLALQYDAAYVNWGEGWCMPTTQEFSTLKTNTSTTISNFTTTGEKKGLTINGTSLFFPAVGCGAGNSLNHAGTRVYYWSSLLQSSSNGRAYYMDVYNNSGNVFRTDGDDEIRLGCPIRPIYKNPVDPLGIDEYDEPENIE